MKKRTGDLNRARAQAKTIIAAARREAEERARRSRDWLRARPGVVAGLLLAASGFSALVAGLAVGSWNAVCRDCPSIAQIYVWEPKSATRILDRDRKLIAELFEERRTPVDIGTLPEYVPQAFIAVEDKRFYRHDGFDYRRLVSAAVRNVVSGRITGGGSTITQQLARWMFTEEIGFQRSGLQGPARKLKEARVARELEDVYEKDDILEAYINQVNYGHGWHGIETAAQHYFGKPAVHLTIGEAAMLAAVINRPGSYSPFRNPERARSRRDLVLHLMEAQGFITEEQLRAAQEEPLPTTPYRNDESRLAPYFVEWVRDMLDDRFGSDLYSKGFKVVTTLDLEMQRAAQAAMDSGWVAIERTPGFRGPKYADVIADENRPASNETPYLQGMFIALDPASGEIRALVGGRDFQDSKFNRATQALRQPGSTFKPFVYAAAIASGIPASHVIYDSPVMLEQQDGSIYSPQNYDPDFRGPLTLRDALKHSVNTVAVKLGIEVGLETVAQTARQMGLRTEIPPYHSTPIGAPDVIPLQLAEAYTPLANTGTLVRSRPILRVEDQDGRVLWETRPEREMVLDSMAAAIVRDMLRTALDNGTGYNVRNPALGNLPYDVPAAGKTGTTNDATNVWFAGFTPDLVAVVWFGFDRPRKITGNATGGLLAAPVWGRFMRSIYYGEEPELEVPQPWIWPGGITTRRIDRETGKLAAQWCPEENAYTEFFIPGTEPTEACGPSGGLFGAPFRRFNPDTTAVDSLQLQIRRRFRF
jgi:penicillin-binding protein 1A